MAKLVSQYKKNNEFKGASSSNQEQSKVVLEDNRKPDIQRKEKILQRNNTGLPDHLKSGMENLSGINLDQVKVHYNSSKPAAIQAHAYAQGNEIHLASGQEKHLPHELGHVVQQAQGRVKPTTNVAGIAVNDHVGLENEATQMGEKALQAKSINSQTTSHFSLSKNNPSQAWLQNNPIQGAWWDDMQQSFNDWKGSTFNTALKGAWYGGKMGVDTGKAVYNSLVTNQPNPGPKEYAIGTLGGLAAGSISTLVGGAVGAVASTAYSGAGMAYNYFTQGKNSATDMGQAITGLQNNNEQTLPLFAAGNADTLGNKGRRVGRELQQTFYPAYSGAVDMPMKIYDVTKNQLGLLPGNNFLENAHNAATYGMAGSAAALTELTSLPIGLAASGLYGTDKLLGLASDYIAPGPIASMTGPFNLHAALAGSPDEFGVAGSSSSSVLHDIGRSGLTADLFGAAAQTYGGIKDIALGHRFPTLASNTVDEESRKRQTANGLLNLFQGGTFIANDLISGSHIADDGGRSGSYFASALSDWAGYNAPEGLATGSAVALNSLYALYHGYQAADSQRKLNRLSTIEAGMAQPDLAPLTGAAFVPIFTGHNVDEAQNMEIIRRGKMNAEDSRNNNLEAFMAGGLGAASLMGGPWGWLLGAAASTLGLHLGAKKLMSWITSTIGWQDQDEVDRRKVARRLASELTKAGASPTTVALGEVFGVNAQVRADAMAPGPNGGEVLYDIIYSEMSKW